jgi:adenosylhomocysteine nucleosidase
MAGGVRIKSRSGPDMSGLFRRVAKSHRLVKGRPTDDDGPHARGPKAPEGRRDRRVFYVMAVDAEYGPHLKDRFTPLMTGVGPVEAAVVLSARPDASRDRRPIAVAGRLARLGRQPHAGAGRIYQATSVSYRDTGLAARLHQRRHAVPRFAGRRAAAADGSRHCGATLSTGVAIVSGKAYDAIEAEMVEMETFAVLRACQLYRVPLVGLRGISDGAADLRHVGDWTEYLHVIDEKLAEAVDRLEQAIADEDLQWPAR